MANSIETTLKEYASWHIRNPAAHRNFDSDSHDETWGNGFDHGYESGRIRLIQELLGIIAMEKIRAENE